MITPAHGSVSVGDARDTEHSLLTSARAEGSVVGFILIIAVATFEQVPLLNS
ncbi:hypothetical protein NU08_4272 [Flavobacterium anhuiense]|uniref:Uncharacterized protein n=1 Tax=Flavobacterium anhuiense TaxID=459526 RepID=A0A444VTF2_9FLAO|nr:hypothetical protein NU08_4272 [Flavobacterium anhuiense]